MAQLGARLNGIEEVEGSNPSGSTPTKAPVLVTGVFLTAKAGVVGYLLESWGHRVKAPTRVFAERRNKAELACFL